MTVAREYRFERKTQFTLNSIYIYSWCLALAGSSPSPSKPTRALSVPGAAIYLTFFRKLALDEAQQVCGSFHVTSARDSCVERPIFSAR